MTAKTTKPKRFRLVINHPNEDRPRLFTAKGRAFGGQFLFAMRTVVGGPQHDGQTVQGILLHVPKRPRKARGEKTAPPHVARMHLQTDVKGLRGPLRPRVDIDPRDGQRLARQVAQRLGRRGPTAMKGTWRGWLLCDERAGPRLHLERKLGSYLKLSLYSAPGDGGWVWKLERSEKWFGANADLDGGGSTFLEAVDAAYSSVATLVGPACSVRDTQRRQAHDAAYAAQRPSRLVRQRAPATRTFRETGIGTWTRLSARQVRWLRGSKIQSASGHTTTAVEQQLRAVPPRATAGATMKASWLLREDMLGADGKVEHKRGALVYQVLKDGDREEFWISSKRFVRLLNKLCTSGGTGPRASKVAMSGGPKRTRKKAATKKPAAKKATTKKAAPKKATTKKPAAKKATPRNAPATAASRVDPDKAAALAQAVAQGAQQGMFALFGSP
jgi:hypothetical protein